MSFRWVTHGLGRRSERLVVLDEFETRPTLTEKFPTQALDPLLRGITNEQVAPVGFPGCCRCPGRLRQEGRAGGSRSGPGSRRRSRPCGCRRIGCRLCRCRRCRRCRFCRGWRRCRHRRCRQGRCWQGCRSRCFRRQEVSPFLHLWCRQRTSRPSGRLCCFWGSGWKRAACGFSRLLPDAIVRGGETGSAKLAFELRGDRLAGLAGLGSASRGLHCHHRLAAIGLQRHAVAYRGAVR